MRSGVRVPCALLSLASHDVAPREPQYDLTFDGIRDDCPNRGANLERTQRHRAPSARCRASRAAAIASSASRRATAARAWTSFA